MDRFMLFGISVGMSFIAWGLVTSRHIWPRLRHRATHDALRPLLLLHTFRFAGLVFLIPGVVSPDLPREFAEPAAYGDLTAAVLALVALLALGTAAGTPLVWLFNVGGTLDLLYAFYQALFGVGVTPDLLGAAYFIPTIVVPILLITHGLMFRLLLRPTAG